MGVRSPVWHAEAVKWAIGAAGAQDVESDRIRYDDRPSPLNASALLIAKPGRAAELRAWPLPAWILDCICGKKIVERVRVDLGQT